MMRGARLGLFSFDTIGAIGNSNATAMLGTYKDASGPQELKSGVIIAVACLNRKIQDFLFVTKE